MAATEGEAGKEDKKLPFRKKALRFAGEVLLYLGPVVFVCAVLYFYFWYIPTFAGGSSPREWPGTFGDMFGGVNALFSGLAFAGIVITLVLQRHELSLQRKELTLTRKVLKGQQEVLTKQALDSTLFGIFKVLDEKTDEIGARNIHHKRPAIVLSICKQEYSRSKERDTGGKTKTTWIATPFRERDTIKMFEEMYLSGYQRCLEPFFTLVAAAYRAIEYAALDEMDHGIYLGIMSAKLDDEDKLLLLFYAATDAGMHLNSLVQDAKIALNMPDSFVEEYPSLAEYWGVKRDEPATAA